jgi:signal transduction histidine kinase
LISNEEQKYGMSSDFTNVDLSHVVLPQKTEDMIEKAYSGLSESYNDYDTIYERTMIHLATPIKNTDNQVIGVIILNSAVESQENTILQYQKYMVISIVIALVASIFLVTFFTRQISSPISKMKQFAFKLAKGDYKDKTNIKRRDEIGDLAKSLDILSEKLKEAEEMRDNMEQGRRDFFANISHELRTPITVLKGYAESLADGYISEEAKQKDYYMRMLKECAGMERLVADLLTLSKIQNPDFVMEMEVTNVIAIIQDVLRSMRVILSKRNIAITMEYEDEKSFVLCDYDRIRQLFFVLVQNAVKYSEDGNSIEIFIGKENKKIVIMITDHGIGIEEEQKDVIFEKFIRGQNHEVKDGSGLGLVIAKSITERHGGTIEVNSSLGEGSCFIVRLPEAEPPDM